jgi:hypothetical protein
MEGWCGGWRVEKNLKSYLKKKRSSKFFRTGILEVGLRTPWGGGGGAKFISSPWAQKWLATALAHALPYTSFPELLVFSSAFNRFLKQVDPSTFLKGFF